MKTPEEIKKGLECCIAQRDGRCEEYDECACCPYFAANPSTEDIFALIQQIEAERDSALSLIGKLVVILRNFPHADAKECANKAYNAVKNWMLHEPLKEGEHD